MESKIHSFEDLSDSKEIMLKKAPKGMVFFIMISFAILMTALIWSYFGKIDTYVTAQGEIRPQVGLDG